MLDPQIGAQLVFQLLVKRAAIGKDTAIPDFLQIGMKSSSGGSAGWVI
jgi:hypothetical protein